jgi:catechol 2,3-dioxygenase-like lactoylglutathione lyase family enzyme
MAPRIDVVGLVVRDLDAALAFYRRLGLEIPDDPDPEGHGHVEATLPGGLRIAWDTYEVMRSFDPGWSEPSGRPGMSLAFRVDSPGEVDELYAELVGAGYEGHLEPFDAFWGHRYATLRDPDGNPVDLFAPLDG